MNELAAFALFVVPLLGFVSAGMHELRRDRQSLRSLPDCFRSQSLLSCLFYC